MGISLQKGQKVNLTKGTNLKNVRVCLGWDTNKYDGGAEFDLDASAFLLNARGKALHDTDFVFYNNLTHPSGAVEHSGDNLTGGGDGDDEIISVYLEQVPQEVDKIDFTVTIHDAINRRQNFGLVSNAFIRLVDVDTDQEVVRFDLGEDFSIETALVFGSIYRHQGEWKFDAVGAGYQGGLAALVKDYGLDVE